MNHPGDIFITLAVICTAALSCAKESTESIPSSDIPVSFSASGSWDGATKTATDGNTTVFTAGDRIGVFAYHNDSSTPDFMNDQPVQFDGTSSWSYSPIKYWPAAQNDKLSFYAYSPYSKDSRDHISIDGNGRAPTLTYSNPDADIDLLAGEAPDMECSARDTVALTFRHLLARVNFAFTYIAGSSDKLLYEPVIHIVQFGEIPYSGTYSFAGKVWTKSNASSYMKRYSRDVAGVVITKPKQIVDDFTCYLLPGVRIKGDFQISINNIMHTYTIPADKEFDVKEGYEYTLNFSLTRNDTGHYFIASFLMWDNGGEYNGELK